jgi:hypothetical protein
MKMLGFWEYFSTSFSNPQKTFKKIKKAQNPRSYLEAVKEMFGRERWVFKIVFLIIFER